MAAKSLDGKAALVTGAAGGIGLAIAHQFARAGARVALHDHPDRADLDEACDSVRRAGAPRAAVFRADARDPDALSALVEAAGAWSPIDILVNNAGIQHTAPIVDMPPLVWDSILAVNLSAAFHTMRFVLPGMAARGYGRVINIASVHGLVASANKAAYVTSKFGLIGLTRVAALEYAAVGDAQSGGVTANCICPGWTDTALIAPQIEERAAAAGGDRRAGIEDLLREKQPSRRMTAPGTIASAAVWLCGHEAHNVTGIALPIDGGWTAW